MDHGEFPALAHLRMGVDVVGFSVGGPAGVADTGGAGQGPALLRQIGQRLQAALGLAYLQTVRSAHGDAGGVIAPVFQPAQSLQQQRRRLLRTHISYDSTHNIVPPDNGMIKRTNAQYLSFLLRRQPLCFAVARIFVNCLTHPEAVRESTRRIFDTLSSSSSCPQAGAGAPVGISVR